MEGRDRENVCNERDLQGKTRKSLSPEAPTLEKPFAFFMPTMTSVNPKEEVRPSKDRTDDSRSTTSGRNQKAPRRDGGRSDRSSSESRKQSAPASPSSISSASEEVVATAMGGNRSGLGCLGGRWVQETVGRREKESGSGRSQQDEEEHSAPQEGASISQGGTRHLRAKAQLAAEGSSGSPTGSATSASSDAGKREDLLCGTRATRGTSATGVDEEGRTSEKQQESSMTGELVATTAGHPLGPAPGVNVAVVKMEQDNVSGAAAEPVWTFGTLQQAAAQAQSQSQQRQPAPFFMGQHSDNQSLAASDAPRKRSADEAPGPPRRGGKFSLRKKAGGGNGNRVMDDSDPSTHPLLTGERRQRQAAEAELAQARSELQVARSELADAGRELMVAHQMVARAGLDWAREKQGRERVREACEQLTAALAGARAELAAARACAAELEAELEGVRGERERALAEVHHEREAVALALAWREHGVHLKLMEAQVAFHERFALLEELQAELHARVALLGGGGGAPAGAGGDGDGGSKPGVAAAPVPVPVPVPGNRQQPVSSALRAMSGGAAAASSAAAHLLSAPPAGLQLAVLPPSASSSSRQPQVSHSHSLSAPPLFLESDASGEHQHMLEAKPASSHAHFSSVRLDQSVDLACAAGSAGGTTGSTTPAAAAAAAALAAAVGGGGREDIDWVLSYLATPEGREHFRIAPDGSPPKVEEDPEAFTVEGLMKLIEGAARSRPGASKSRMGGFGKSSSLPPSIAAADLVGQAATDGGGPVRLPGGTTIAMPDGGVVSLPAGCTVSLPAGTPLPQQLRSTTGLSLGMPSGGAWRPSQATGNAFKGEGASLAGGEVMDFDEVACRLKSLHLGKQQIHPDSRFGRHGTSSGGASSSHVEGNEPTRARHVRRGSSAMALDAGVAMPGNYASVYMHETRGGGGDHAALRRPPRSTRSSLCESEWQMALTGSPRPEMVPPSHHELLREVIEEGPSSASSSRNGRERASTQQPSESSWCGDCWWVLKW